MLLEKNSSTTVESCTNLCTEVPDFDKIDTEIGGFVSSLSYDCASDGILLSHNDESFPTSSKELCTGFLNVGDIDAEISEFADFLVDCNILEVLVSYGFGCKKIHPHVKEEIPVSAGLLCDFIHQIDLQGIYRFGQADLLIYTNDGRIQFFLCHEADIHFCSNDLALYQKVKERWQNWYPNSYEKENSGDKWL